MTTEGDRTTRANGYALHGANGDMLEGLSGDAAIVRIQELLSHWIQMENVVVMLGAGASVSHGGPVMSDLETDVLGTFESISAEDKLLTQLLPVINQRIDDGDGKTAFGFEQWLSALGALESTATVRGTPIESVTLRAKGGALPIDVPAMTRALDVLAEIIQVRCDLELPPLNDRGPSGHHALVSKLVARDPVLGRAQVFTTNYDTLIEQALDALSIRYADGFSGTVTRRLDSADHLLDVYYPGEVSEGRVRRYDKFLHVHKLHGSVHWRRTAAGEIHQVARPGRGDWTEWLAASAEKRLSEFASDGSRVAILPTDGKYVATLGMPYAHNLRAFQRALQTPQTFVVVAGYGFSDAHVNTMIDEGMTNPGVALLVIDPFGSAAIHDRVRRYQEAGERAFLLSGPGNEPDSKPEFATFDDFATNLLPNVRWLEDYLRIRKMEAALREPDSSDDASSGGAP